jgi:hypothetical protein
MVFSAKLRGEWREVACSSKAKYDKITKQKEKGYVPSEAKVQFVVSWRNEENEERPIVLPILRMKKARQTPSDI